MGAPARAPAATPGRAPARAVGAANPWVLVALRRWVLALVSSLTPTCLQVQPLGGLRGQNHTYFASPEGLRGQIPTYSTRVAALGEAGAHRKPRLRLGVKGSIQRGEPRSSSTRPARPCLLRPRSSAFVGALNVYLAGSLERSARRHGLRSCNARGLQFRV